MSDPRIIRTVEELEALDPDTLVMFPGHSGLMEFWEASLTAYSITARVGEASLPAVVIRDGADVRAALEALEEA